MDLSAFRSTAITFDFWGISNKTFHKFSSSAFDICSGGGESVILPVDGCVTVHRQMYRDERAGARAASSSLLAADTTWLRHAPWRQTSASCSTGAGAAELTNSYLQTYTCSALLRLHSVDLLPAYIVSAFLLVSALISHSINKL